MGIFGNSSAFDNDVEKATSENNTSEEWGLILEICDRASASAAASKECLRSVLRRLAHQDPHVAVQAATLLDACVSNCGRGFHLEVASRDFEAEFRRVLARAQPAVARRLRALLRKWADGEFRSDPQLDLVPSLYQKLRQEGHEFDGEPAPAAPARRASPAPAPDAGAREQEELARAIALSLQDAKRKGGAPLYPQVEPPAGPQPPPPAAQKVRALYDFEAAEDNELTFLADEIVHVTDSSDPNWWKGYNKRGEGLFPANFVTADLERHKGEARAGKSVQFAADVTGAGAAAGAEPDDADEEEAEPAIDESKMDAALAALHDANPEDASSDPPAALRLEGAVYAMGPLIDAALQTVDLRHANLTQLSADLVEALNLYHSLMREPLKAPAAAAPPPHQMFGGAYFAGAAPPQPPQPPQPPHYN